ncbi:hypothetical protein [Helicobacter salomonis]|uniref:hypothetical protein n=1 Tax=Helicobacter salomonis TaxID=56878 RepID=UPI000CF02200|nr:hypothetical protein [Helicobacter salomonis]
MSIKQQCRNFLKRMIPQSWHQPLRRGYGFAHSLFFLRFVRSLPLLYYMHPQKQSVFSKITPLNNEDYIQANRLCGEKTEGVTLPPTNSQLLIPDKPLHKGYFEQDLKASNPKSPLNPWVDTRSPLLSIKA